MSVYGIAGYSGAGKTTTAQKLKSFREFLGKKGVVLEGDPFHGLAFAKHVGAEAREIYNDPEVVHDDGVLKGRVLYEKPEEYLRLIGKAMPHALDDLAFAIEAYDKQGLDVFVPWIYVPVKTSLYDKTINIDISTSKRHDRLINRTEHSCPKDRAIKRDNVLHAVMANFKPNYVISNNGSQTRTEQQIKELAQNL